MSPGAPVSSAPSCASSAADSAPRTRTAHPARSARTCAQKQTHRCTQCRRTSKDFSALTPYEAKLALHTRVGSGACRPLLWEPPLPQHAPTTNQPWSSERGKERSCYIDSQAPRPTSRASGSQGSGPSPARSAGPPAGAPPPTSCAASLPASACWRPPASRSTLPFACWLSAARPPASPSAPPPAAVPAPPTAASGTLRSPTSAGRAAAPAAAAAPGGAAAPAGGSQYARSARSCSAALTASTCGSATGSRARRTCARARGLCRGPRASPG